MIGRTIGHYRIVAQLGRGGSGTVYQAVDLNLSREVAVKILNPDLANTEAMKRFCTEATILARLNHPSIATIYELYRAETDLLMVMELVRGETLDALSDRLGPLPPDRAAYLVERILSALEHAHRAGVVHRDMKSGNVMVTDTAAVKVMDFGIARIHGAQRITGDGCMIGTPAYMAPEQVLNEDVDARTDLYAVGVILYRLLAVALPFEAHTPIAVLQRQLTDTPTPLRYHREGLPDWCDAIVGRALAKVPADRFQSAEEFRESLVRAAGLVTTADLAKALGITESPDVDTSPPRHPTQPLSIPLADAGPASPRTGVVSTDQRVMTARPAAKSQAPPPGEARPPLLTRYRTIAVASAALLVVAATLVAPVVLRNQATQIVPGSAAGPVREPAARPATGTAAMPVTESPASAAARRAAKTAAEPVPKAGPTSPAKAAIASRPGPATKALAKTPVAPQANPTPVPAPAVMASTGPTPGLAAGGATGPPTTAASPPPSESPSSPAAVTSSAPVTFALKALVVAEGKPQARDARLALAGGTITVVLEGEAKPTHSVAYESVASINHSFSRDPMWRSPTGPARVMRASGGILGALRLAGAHDWISLATAVPDRFVVLRADPAQVQPLLAALELRTGLRARRIADIGPTYRDRPDRPLPKKKK